MTTTTKTIRGDLFGGATAAIVALPLALAFGVSSGAGPIAGLYGAILVGFFASLFGGTPSQISGPTGPMTVVMAAIIMEYMGRDPETGLALAFTVVMLAGLFQMLFGFLRLGKYIIQVPYPVISGFMSGIGVIIIVLQLGPLLGHAGSSGIIQSLAGLPAQFAHPVHAAAVVGLMTLGIMYVTPKRLNRYVPAPLLALFIGTLVSVLVFDGEGVPRIGEIPTGLPMPHWPVFQPELIKDMVGSALLLAGLGSIDSLLTSLVADNMTRHAHRSDRELVGQGVGNLVAGLFGAIPGAGATMRTVVNINTGGSTRFSGMLHAVILLAIVLGAGPLASSIPHAVLAGILVKVGVDIIDWGFIKRLHEVPLFSSALMLGVLGFTVFVDLITAVLLGAFVANMVTIERLTHLQLDKLRFINDGDDPNLAPPDARILDSALGKLLLMTLEGPMSFGVARAMRQRLAENRDYQALVIDMTDTKLVGITTCIAIEEIVLQHRADGRAVYLACLSRKVRRSFAKLKILDLVPERNRFRSRTRALTAAAAFCQGKRA